MADQDADKWAPDHRLRMHDLITSGLITKDTSVKDVKQSRDPQFAIFRNLEDHIISNHLSVEKKKAGLTRSRRTVSGRGLITILCFEKALKFFLSDGGR
jgi:superoxide dismutase